MKRIDHKIDHIITNRYLLLIIIATTTLLLASCAHHSLSEEIIPEGPNTPETPGYTAELVFESMLEESSSQNTSTSGTRAGGEAYAMMHKKGYENFGIWAWRYGSPADFNSHANEQSVMNHYRVSYSTEYAPNGVHPDNTPYYGWGYDKETGDPFDLQILKYWDLSSYIYQFKGYAPYSETPGQAELTNGNVVIHDINGHIAYRNAYPNTGDPTTNATALSTGNIDWVVCQWQRLVKSPLGDKDLLYPNATVPSISYPYARVPLCFHHLLPNVNFVIKYEDGTSRYATIGEFKVEPIRLNGNQAKFPTSATCTITETPDGEHMTPTWDIADKAEDPEVLMTGFVKRGNPGATEIHDPTDSDTPGYPDYQYTYLTPEGGVLMIPNTGEYEGYILFLTLSVYPQNGASKQTFYGTIGTVIDPVIWESDKKYTYILTITGADILKLAVNVADWEDGTGDDDPILGGGGF